MKATTKKNFQKLTGCKVNFDDWYIRISPSSQFTLHRPTLDKFSQLSGQQGIELCAMAKGILDTLPKKERYGEVVAQVPELGWRYCLFFGPGEILVYDPELIGGKPFEVQDGLGTVGKDKWVCW